MRQSPAGKIKSDEWGGTPGRIMWVESALKKIQATPEYSGRAFVL
jgi:hypothetical protein